MKGPTKEAWPFGHPCPLGLYINQNPLLMESLVQSISLFYFYIQHVMRHVCSSLNRWTRRELGTRRDTGRCIGPAQLRPWHYSWWPNLISYHSEFSRLTIYEQNFIYENQYKCKQWSSKSLVSTIQKNISKRLCWDARKRKRVQRQDSTIYNNMWKRL